MKSWRTSTSGILAIVVAVGTAVQLLIDGNPATNPDWGTVGAAVLAGVGLLTARDNKVSSESAGAK
jgi:hypothetical protein